MSTAVLAAAEDTPQLEFVHAQQANSAALREYTWKSRTELTLKGEVKNVKLEQVRHDLDGRLQKTCLGGTPDPSEERFDPRAPRVGPVQRIVTAKKKEEFGRVEIATSLEGEAVEIAVDYRSLPNGLTYQARSLLRYPHRQVALAVENFEFQHAGGTR